MDHSGRARGDSPVLFLAIAFPPDPITGAARPGRFARYLPAFGYRPRIIARRDPAVPDPDAAVHRIPLENPGAGDRFALAFTDLIQRYLLPYSDSFPWAAVAYRHARRIFRQQGPCAVLSTSPPIGLHLAALRLKLRYGVPWIADFRDPLLGNPFRTRRWWFPLDRILENLVFRHADAVIANTDALGELWRARHPRWKHKIEVIWNGFDPQQPIQAEPLPPRPYRVLSHAGSLYGGRHPVSLLRSVDRLITAGRLDPAMLRLQFIGTVDPGLVDRHRTAFDAVAAHGCLDLDTRTVSPEQATRASATADYLLLLDLNQHNTNLQVPAKLFEYIRIGRPVLAFTGPDSPVERILSRSGIPFRSISPEASDNVVDQSVLEFLSLPPDPSPPGEWFTTTFNGIEQTRHLAGILRKIGVPPQSAS